MRVGEGRDLSEALRGKVVVGLAVSVTLELLLLLLRSLLVGISELLVLIEAGVEVGVEA